MLPEFPEKGWQRFLAAKVRVFGRSEALILND
jgi:hypothetical protein